jgi:HTH-type transcriptional regulator/antitoxin MqsA
MKCPVCKAADLVHDTRDLLCMHKDETTAMPDVTADFCWACGQSVLNAVESARVMNVMTGFAKEVNASPVDAAIVERPEDAELAKTVMERAGEEPIPVNLNDL